MAGHSTSDSSRRSGDIIANALREPVTITQRNKDRLVLLSVEEYRRLLERGGKRRAAALDAMFDDRFGEFEKAVDAYEAEPEGRRVSRTFGPAPSFAILIFG